MNNGSTAIPAITYSKAVLYACSTFSSLLGHSLVEQVEDRALRCAVRRRGCNCRRTRPRHSSLDRTAQPLSINTIASASVALLAGEFSSCPGVYFSASLIHQQTEQTPGHATSQTLHQCHIGHEPQQQGTTPGHQSAAESRRPVDAVSDQTTTSVPGLVRSLDFNHLTIGSRHCKICTMMQKLWGKGQHIRTRDNTSHAELYSWPPWPAPRHQHRELQDFLQGRILHDKHPV